jgi:hypothetical protein
MDDNHDATDRSAMPAAMPQANSVSNASGPASNADRRAERIDEYHRDLLESNNPHLAILGAGIADLMYVRYKLACSVRGEIDSEPLTLKDYQRDFAPAVNNMLTIDRQILAYCRFVHDLDRAASSAGGAPSRREKQDELRRNPAS